MNRRQDPFPSAEELLPHRRPAQPGAEADCRYLTGSTVLVTGGGGSVGGELCRQIAKLSPEKLVILDSYENDAYELAVSLWGKYGRKFPLDVVIASVRDKQRLREVFAQYRPRVVFHAAAHKHVPLMESNPAEAVKNNVMGTWYAAEAAACAKAERFVLISTDKAVHPVSIMGASKYLCELIMQYWDEKADSTSYASVRFGNVLGSNGSVLSLFAQQAQSGGPITVTHPEASRYFITLPEAARLVLQAGSLAGKGAIFVPHMGEPVMIDQLARTFLRGAGLEPERDIPIAYIGLRPGEKLHEELWYAEKGSLRESGIAGILQEPPHSISAKEIKKRIFALLAQTKKDPAHVHAHMERAVPQYKRQG